MFRADIFKQYKELKGEEFINVLIKEIDFDKFENCNQGDDYKILGDKAEVKLLNLIDNDGENYLEVLGFVKEKYYAKTKNIFKDFYDFSKSQILKIKKEIEKEKVDTGFAIVSKLQLISMDRNTPDFNEKLDNFVIRFFKKQARFLCTQLCYFINDFFDSCLINYYYLKKILGIIEGNLEKLKNLKEFNLVNLKFYNDKFDYYGLFVDKESGYISSQINMIVKDLINVFKMAITRGFSSELIIREINLIFVKYSCSENESINNFMNFINKTLNTIMNNF